MEACNRYRQVYDTIAPRSRLSCDLEKWRDFLPGIKPEAKSNYINKGSATKIGLLGRYQLDVPVSECFQCTVMGILAFVGLQGQLRTRIVK